MMKTILSLTDFSKPATNAANYAFQLAQAVKANLLLCTAIKIPVEAPLSGGLIWPIEDYATLIDRYDAELNALAEHLTVQNKLTDLAKPRISIKTDLGSVPDVVRELVLLHQINMVVMGLSGAGEMSRFFLGSSSRDVIAGADFPTLLVPKQCTFKPFKKIAFATDLNAADLKTLQSLCGLAKIFHAELLIVHVMDQSTGSGEQARVDDFITEVKSKLNYDKIYYKNLHSRDVESGLEWMGIHGQIDCLAMVHRRESFLNAVLKGSHSQKMARLTEVPLLIFPDHYKTVLC